MKRPLVVAVVAASVIAACRSTPDASTASPSTSAQAALDRLDTRAPVPLLPMMANHQKENMREHLVAVEEIVAGVASNDFEAIERASKRIGFSEQMGMMCTHMGAGAPGFTDRALAFHHTADKIGDAARGHDMNAVLAALGETMKACTSCHAAFKQEVVGDEAYAAATGGGAPVMHHEP